MHWRFNSFNDFTISIHAPTRGATANANYDKRERLFQSTLPRGERLLSVFRKKLFGDFNPRSHEGSDWILWVERYERERFQSTLPRGERLMRFKTKPWEHQFQSTLPRGERRNAL